MSERLGLSILDLLPQTSNIALQVPDGIVEKIGVLTILDHRSTSSDDFFLHEGTLQSPTDALGIDTSQWAVKIPGLTQGLPFRLALQRTATPAGQEEPTPQLWTIDIEIWDVEILIPGLRAAVRVGGDGVRPLTVKPLVATADAQQVFLVGRGVVRISGGGAAGTVVQVVDSPDPLDPSAPTGGVVRLTARPSSFMFGQSEYGMTVSDFVIDFSETFTPPEVVARGHDEVWQGLSFREATFYFPADTPLVRSLSIDTRDVIIGDPGGLQGELRLEFGEDFAAIYNARISVTRQQGDSEVAVPQSSALSQDPTVEFAVPEGPNGTAQRARAHFELSAISGRTDLAIVGVYWMLPDGREGNDEVTPWFDAPTTKLLHYRLRAAAPGAPLNIPDSPATVPDGQTELGEVTVRFPRTAAGPSGIAPHVDATIDGIVYNNVIHLRGPRSRLQGLVLGIRGGTNGEWRLGGGSAPHQNPGAPTFTLPLLPDGFTSGDLTVKDDNGVRRIRVEATRQGPLVIGHQATDSNASAGLVTIVGQSDASPTSVTETFLASPFHLEALRQGAPAAATLNGTEVTVPPGTDAEVEVPVPAGTNDPVPAPVIPPNISSATVQMLFDYDQSTPVRIVYPYDGGGTEDDAAHDVDARPMAVALTERGKPDGTDPVAQLHSWLNALGAPNGRKYFVVGRTDDLRQNGTEDENNQYNKVLADSRAQAAVDALIAAGASPSDITSRNESAPWGSGLPGTPPARITRVARLALPGQVTTPPGKLSPVWNGLWTADSPNHAAAIADPHREPYRCAEIYVVDTGAPAPAPAPLPSQDGVLVNILVPGPDGDPPPPLKSTSASGPPTDYRVRLQVKWDSPTVVNASDAIPTEAEALVAWKAAQIELPATASGGATTLPKPTPAGVDFWQVLLKWTYDSRTGETEATGALSLPDGTLNWQDNGLAGALAFGPAFAAILDKTDVIHDQYGEFIAAAALFGVGFLIGDLINSGDTKSSVDIDAFTISYKWNGAAHVAAKVDYTVDLRVNVSADGAGSLIGHLKLAYKGVGVRFDGKSGGGGAGIALTYDDLSVQVVDPGTWSLGGVLGNLIRIAASRMGNGSQWMEFDLAFALDLGVVTLEGATVRLGIEPFALELRGLTAVVDIPSTIEGKGSISIGGGAFRALLALEVIPAKISAYGALAIDQDFVSVEVGVQLPVGIPLGNTGFGIFGFMGRFAANGTRNLDGLIDPDPVQRQLDWYVREPDQKYRRLSGQFAFGVGAVVGTLPDGAFTFNADGSLTIGFPDVSVVFGIDAHLLSERKSQATETGTGNGSSLRILGMVLIDETSIMLAVRGSYEIPGVLRLAIPISAYFPLAGTDAWFIRIGADNEPATPDHPARPGSPVSITLLPDLLDVRAWAFTMIEERQLHHLGGSIVPLDLAQPLDFDGFSIGMGAGFDLKYSAGPFRLEITAFLLVGVGTKPLLFAGAIGINGELDLVIVSVGVDGQIHFHISPGYSFINGHFCGHVDFFFFSVGGCVDIRIGDDPPSDIPVPDSPFVGLDLCDHLAVVKGRGAAADGDDVPAVWPDTVAVLKCTHYVEDGLGVDDFNRRLPPPAPLSPWFGSTELKYAYKLKALELWKLTGGDPNVAGGWTKISGPFDSAWWLPSHRSAVIEGGDTTGPSTEEGRELGLFSWDPRAWSRWLGEGSQDLPGDPANTVGHVCDSAEPADPSCAFGKDWTAAVDRLGGFKAEPAPGSAFPTRFTVFADLAYGLASGVLAGLGADAGWSWYPGLVAPLHGGVSLHGNNVIAGWRFPEWRAQGRMVATAPIALSLSRPIVQGELVLEVCSGRQIAPLPKPLCDHVPPGNEGLKSFVGDVSKSKYVGQHMQAFAAGDGWALQLIEGGLQGEFPGTVDQVAVDIDANGGTATLTAFDARNVQLGQSQTTTPGRQPLRFQAKGIARIALQGDHQPVIYEVCWGGDPTLAILQTVDFPDLNTPRVVAHDVTGASMELIGTPVMPLPGPGPSPAIVDVPTCPKLLYELPEGPGWTRVEISPWRGGDVSLVAWCGVTVEAAAAQQADADFRDALANLLVAQAGLPDSNQPTHAVYLDSETIYEIRAAWQYQGFRPAHPGEEAPPTALGTWTDAPSERFRFSTAAFGLATIPAPSNTTSPGFDVDPAQGGPGYDERTFDPRGIARYITAAAPTHEDPPQFLDDPVGFWFMVDHLESLVEKYDRILQVKVLHTTPPAGSQNPVLVPKAGARHPLDVTRSVEWRVNTLSWFEADYRLVQAATAAPCIGRPPALGSSSVAVAADLEPRQEYDLLLNAEPKTEGTYPEVTIARTHFRTSRYRNPAELLHALGFNPSAVSAPLDVIAAGPLAPGTLEIGDTALDAALTTLGLDPWPLPAAPRTTVIWLPPAGPGQPWRLAAVLIEADEPISRAGFRTGAIGEPGPPARLEVKSLTVFHTFDRMRRIPVHPPRFISTPVRLALGSLNERVRSGGATRSIFVPADPIAMTGGRLYDLQLSFTERGVAGATGLTSLADRPLMIVEEGE